MKIRRTLTCICAVALLAPCLVPPLLAQVDHGPVENRLLLVFDTSSAMKKRLPAEEKAINELFDITLNGHLRPGDSIGVWTFNRDLHTGEFPLRPWSSELITTFPPQLVAFLKNQRYTKDTRFDALLPTLSEIVRTSPRLTVIIFCDGDGHVTDIPAAVGINQTFKQRYHQMAKARVPFVIVLRSQIGRDGTGGYVGCTINSAQSISLPEFPPLPRPPTPPAPAKTAPTPPAPVAPSLIIIGTNSPATNQPPPPTPTPAPAPQQQPTPPPPMPAPVRPNAPSAPVPPAPSPAPSIPMSATNFVPPPPAAAPIQPTNAAVVPPQAPISTPPPATAQTMPPETAGTGIHGLIAVGAGLFIVVIAILSFILRRARSRNSASLITESMKKDKIHS